MEAYQQMDRGAPAAGEHGVSAAEAGAVDGLIVVGDEACQWPSQHW